MHMDTRMQPHEAYKALPAKVSQHVLKQLADAWKAFREAPAQQAQDGGAQRPDLHHASGE